MPDSEAARLWNGGTETFHRSLSGEPRGPLCGMGVCFECRTGLEGRDSARTCLTPADGTAGSIPDARLECDIAIVGAGPAGIAAATAAAGSGRRVILIDESPDAGGNIWRGRPVSTLPSPARRRIDVFRRSGCRVLTGHSAVDIVPGFEILAAGNDSHVRVAANRVILATGARELFLPFPGWTLPGVVGVGGAQSLLKSGFSFAGRSAVVAGTGPLLLAAAAALEKSGAHVVEIAEQAPFASVARFASTLVASPRRLADALGYRMACRGARYRFGTWVVSAEGADRVRSVTLTDGRRKRSIACELLAAGFGLVPQTELARLAGCRTRDGFIEVDGVGRTSVAGLFCAGELTGIGGVERSLAEGEIAGRAAAGDPAVKPRRKRITSAFPADLARAFRLRDELRDLADETTIICRCEDVPLASLAECRSLREAKLATRAGMGPCQGRICGPALRFLFGWEADSIRPPILPLRIGSLAALAAHRTIDERSHP